MQQENGKSKMLCYNTEKLHHLELIREKASCLFLDYLLLYAKKEISRFISVIAQMLCVDFVLFTFCFNSPIAPISLLRYNLYIVKIYPGLEVISWHIILTFHISKTAAQS